ncbi:hypothetical protein BZA77DRAFT_320176 [Pyronema omphalodes]|nr:hypothetical protein BZA77DRAFT_320176 [Pyronema omphalodes]
MGEMISWGLFYILLRSSATSSVYMFFIILQTENTTTEQAAANGQLSGRLEGLFFQTRQVARFIVSVVCLGNRTKKNRKKLSIKQKVASTGCGGCVYFHAVRTAMRN